MVSHMKTTVNLPDELLLEAKELARQEQTTLTELIATSLRQSIAQRRPGRSTFVLADASVDGRGLQAEFADAGWAQLREAIYQP